jgi:uncharacterized protein YndB with AHSA1/START domain
MPTRNSANAASVKIPPLKLSRVLQARRDTVFRAWTVAEHVERWFSPEAFTTRDTRVRMQIGGPFELCMRSPSGEEHWIRGTFTEIQPNEKLAIDMRITDSAGQALFGALTEVWFADALGGTQLDIVQTYTLLDPSKAWMIECAPDGWRGQLEKLAQQVIHMQGGSGAATRSVVHATFDLERTYDAPVARVWKALTDLSAKQKWFAGTPSKWQLLERQMDVRIGGREILKGRWEGGSVTTFDAVYHDVIPNGRLVYSYQMFIDDRKISVSLATLQLEAQGSGTTLKVTEQGAFLDGYDDAGSREHGTGLLLDALGASLQAS